MLSDNEDAKNKTFVKKTAERKRNLGKLSRLFEFDKFPELSGKTKTKLCLDTDLGTIEFDGKDYKADILCTLSLII